MSDGLQIFDAPQDAVVDDGPAPERHRRRPRWPGALAGGIAILMVLSWALGLVLLSTGLFELGVGLSISAVLLSGIAVVAGAVAVIFNWGRGWGVAAIAVGVLLNPVVLTYLLGLMGVL
ncbi:hypothetical protein [Protaetiibacter intestinalis]|uniref:Uncharacterized protein n=1 Tax=Protaetiibacter intestinalis TaxID=2419774 RepID=A0A387B8K9_9MICO|nr:hypothetical protein [Protaetiibacter intestinalis]AYF98098.1 hypothetical protein D7I47_07410 [Protaetiibacter intestinalis]